MATNAKNTARRTGNGSRHRILSLFNIILFHLIFGFWLGKGQGALAPKRVAR
jgi:hypothetical protein